MKAQAVRVLPAPVAIWMMDEGARLRFGEGLLEVCDRFDAADAGAFSIVRMREWHLG